jgi:hypothetical protein
MLKKSDFFNIKRDSQRPEGTMTRQSLLKALRIDVFL